MNVSAKSPASCPFCGAQNAVRSGLRKTRTGIKQVFRCKTCFRRFSGDSPTACRTPPHVIRRALALVCQDYTYDEALHFIAAHLRIRVSKSAISKWVADFNPPYLAIRKMNAGHRPIVRAHLFTHRGLNYNFQVHQPKLRFCRREGLTRYLGWVAEHLDAAAFEQGPRCSQLRLSRNPGLYQAKNTPLNRLAADARRLAATNRDRHPALEEYFHCCVREHRSSYLDEDDARHPHHRQPKRWTAPDAGRFRASGTSARTDTPRPAAVSRPETQAGTRQGNTP
jgi:transposase-like protein